MIKSIESHDEIAIHLSKWLISSSRRKRLKCFLNFGIRKCRPDVLAFNPTFNLNRLRVSTYEVKFSRTDLLGDIKKGKYKKYFLFSNYVYFVCKKIHMQHKRCSTRMWVNTFNREWF